MVSRMCIILWILEAKMVFWLYEQPQSSLLWQHPRTQQYISKRTVFKSHMWMGAFGAASPKGTVLWGPYQTVSWFASPLPKDRAWATDLTTKTEKNGRTQVTGSKGLKGSQTYPSEFGLATVSIWRRTAFKAYDMEGAKLPNVWPKSLKDAWPDVNLTEVSFSWHFQRVTKHVCCCAKFVGVA